MTAEQTKIVNDAAQTLKAAFPDLFGSIQFCLSGTKKDVKIKVEQIRIAKHGE